MTSATQARGTMSRSPANGTSRLYSSSERFVIALPRNRAAAIDERFDGVEQLVLLIGLAEIVVDAELDRARAVLFADTRGDHDDRDMLETRVIAHVGCNLVAVHARHLDIEQDDVGQIFLQQGE